MKNILIINAHPDAESFGNAIADAYEKGVKKMGAKSQRLNLRELNFSLNLEYGYRKRTDLEPDLIKAQDAISFANHLVFIYPTWWGTFPAILKGFIDRTFLPGFAFKYREDSSLPRKLLKGKSARLITTMDTPAWFYRIFYYNVGHRAMKKSTLGFTGIKPVKITSFQPIKDSTPKKRKNWLQNLQKIGQRDAI